MCTTEGRLEIETHFESKLLFVIGFENAGKRILRAGGGMPSAIGGEEEMGASKGCR